MTHDSPKPTNNPWTAGIPWDALIGLAVLIIRAILDALDRSRPLPGAPLPTERHVKLYRSLSEARDLISDCDAP